MGRMAYYSRHPRADKLRRELNVAVGAATMRRFNPRPIPSETLSRFATHRDSDTVVFSLYGELDGESIEEVEKELLAIDSERPRLIVVELDQLTFIDGDGMRLLAKAALRARQDNRRMLFANPRSELQHTIDTFGLDRIAVVETRGDPAEPAHVPAAPAQG
jgi:anti-anti-sigma factor